MIQKLTQSRWAKAETASWWLSLAKNLEVTVFSFLIFLLPTQLGKHFWFGFSLVLGQRIDYLSPTLYVTDLLLIALLLLTVLQRKTIRLHPLFLGFLLFLSVSIALSSSPLVGWYYFAKFLEVSFFVWYVVHAQVSYKNIGILLAIGVVGESLLAAAQLFFQHSVGGLLYFLGERSFSATTPGIANASIQGALILRPYATFPHPNMLAGYLAAVLFLLVFLFWGKNNISERMLFFLASPIGAIGLALSLSRAAIASWFLVGALLLLMYRKWTRRVLFVLLALGSAMLLATVLFPATLFRFLAIPTGESVTERIILASAALRMVLAHPIFGVGPNNFIVALPHFLQNDVFLQPVHNIYLLVLAEQGFLGFLFFCLFLLLVGKVLLLTWKRAVGGEKLRLLFLAGALLVILLAGLFDHYFLTLQQGQLLCALVIGIILREGHHATIQA